MEVKESAASYSASSELSWQLRAGLEVLESEVNPEGWVTVRLGNIGAFEKGRGVRKDQAESGVIPCVRYGELYTVHHEIIKQFNSHISAQVAKTSKRIFAGDILFAASGETRADIGKSAAFIDEVEAYAGGDIVIFRPDKHVADPRFLGYLLNMPAVVAQKTSKGQGDAVVHITTMSLSSLLVSLPACKSEQATIAETLSDADALIESLDQLIAKKRQIKQGAMQALLTGRQRLPGFGDDWKEITLSDLGSTYGGLTGKTKADFGGGEGRYVTFMNVMSNVVIDSQAFERVKILPSESQNKVMRGDLLFNGSSETPEEVALCAVVTEDTPDLFLNSFCFGFRLRDVAAVDGLFMAYFLRGLAGRELMKSLAQGSTRYNISKASLLRAPLRLPGITEQIAIATILADMDAELAELEARLAKTHQLKQGMMQELLTGRIRLV